MITRFFKIITILSALAALLPASAAEPPRLIINIVLGSMNADALQRYAERFEEGGLKTIVNEGALFTDASYDCMQTLLPASLATISTGTTPSIHGTVAEYWFDYTTGRKTHLVDDERETDFDDKGGKKGHSPRHLTAPTLAEMLMRADSNSRVLSLAISPLSAIVPAGKAGLCFWMDAERCRWTTSTYYSPILPSWVKSYNAEDLHSRYLTGQWVAKFDRDKYVNRHSAVLFGDPDPKAAGKQQKKSAGAGSDFGKVARTPIGNTVLFDFAKYAVKCLNMGNDEHPDILNICLDTAADIAERYGAESVEYEDMIYRLDTDLKEFLAYLNVHLKDKKSLVLMLTSAHGTAPAHHVRDKGAERFNVPQFEVIMNAYLSAKYGQGSWVLGYIDRSLYLNRELADEKQVPLAELQNEAAAFALRFRGVAHALSSHMLQSSYFADGYARKIQNGFYPRRSGDIIVDLMPEWTEEREGTVSHSGSMFRYDTHIPLVFYGTGIAPQQYSAEVDMTSVAPTLARMLGLGELPVADGKPLILEQLKENDYER